MNIAASSKILQRSIIPINQYVNKSIIIYKITLKMTGNNKNINFVNFSVSLSNVVCKFKESYKILHPNNNLITMIIIS